MSKKPQGLRFQSNRKPSTSGIIPVGKKQRLTIERLSHDGRGITTLQDRTWFVTGALPTEEIEARVVSTQSKWVHAKCEKIITAAPIRQTPPCQYAGICGGCELQHIPYAEQIKLKQNSVIDQFQRLANLDITDWQPPLIDKPLHYRRRARIAVRYNEKTKQLDIGFRAAFSQQIVPINHCVVLTESLNQLLQKLPECLQQLTAIRHIGHIELFEGNQTALLVRHTAPLNSIDLNKLVAFCEAQQCQLWLQGKDKPSPVNSESTLNYPLTIEKQSFTLNYQIGDFIQVNADINQLMVQQALDWLNVQSEESILDLFSGLGNFSLPIANKAKQVIGIEVVENMVNLAHSNAKQNGINNTLFYQADLSQPITNKTWIQEKFSAILLDPPREGAIEIIKQMKKLETNRLLYVSCNPSTLARDTKVLIEQGYKIQKAGIMDMFPQTSHIETMVLFER